MNSGTLPTPANDTGAIVAELRALRVQNGTSNVAEMRTQTDTLAAELRALRREVAGLRSDVARGSSMPVRLAS
jgi:hypothetical protein